MDINRKELFRAVLVGFALVSTFELIAPAAVAAPKSSVSISAGGPYQNVEGAQIMLSGAITPQNSSYALSWDLNGDGTADRQGSVAYFASTDNGVFHPTFIARNTLTGLVKRAPASVTIINLAPSVAITGPSSAAVNTAEGNQRPVTHAAYAGPQAFTRQRIAHVIGQERRRGQPVSAVRVGVVQM